MKGFYKSISGLLLALTACKGNYDAPCRNQAVKQQFTFSANEKAKFPFQNRDTIGFSSNASDTIMFYTDTVVKFQDSKMSQILGNPECPADIDQYEGITAQLSGGQKKYQVTFQKSNDSCMFVIGGSIVKLRLSAIDDSSANFSDSVVFFGKTYYHVNTVHTSAADSVMLNASNGIIYFTEAGKSYYQFKFNSK